MIQTQKCDWIMAEWIIRTTWCVVCQELDRHSLSFFSSGQNAEHGFRLLHGGSFWPWEPLVSSMECPTRPCHRSQRESRRWARLTTTWIGKSMPAIITTLFTAFDLCLRAARRWPHTLKPKSVLPDTAHPTIFDGQLFRIVYLNDNKRVLKNEAIEYCRPVG